ncbi:hypothetical protein N9E51_00190 [Alphaproteobacteria bacterium]|nr:hypothetical protein [Alphaproteobacteria bacterium]
MFVFSDFQFSFTDTQIIFSTDNDDFRNSPITMTIKDSNGLTWVNNDGLTNGAGGSGFPTNSDGIYLGSSTVKLPLSVEVLIDHGSGHLFSYSVTSDSNGSTDLSNANVDYIKPLEIYNYDGLFKVHDLFLNVGETYSYQIVDRPSYVSENDTLVSVSLEPSIWWSDPGEQWLTVTNNGLLQGTADFGYKDNSQGYNLILNYESGHQVNDYFQVYVNSYIETNKWSHDQNYNIRYDYEPLNVYDTQSLSLNLSDPNEPRLELRLDNAFNYNPFKIIDQSGVDISDTLDFASGNLFKINHSFMNAGVEGGDEVQVSGYEWRDGGSVLSLIIEPNLYNGQSTIGPDDIFQVSLAQGVQTQTNDGTRAPLNDIIPYELIYQDGVAFEDKISIETTDRWDGAVIDTSVTNNLFGYSGVYINAGSSEVTHSDGYVIPAYSSIAPDGTVLDISAISAEEHGLEIRTSPLDDVIYVNAEEGDWPVVRWSSGDDYILGPNSGAAFNADGYNENYYGNEYSSEGLTFEFNTGVLTVASEYGTTIAENISNVYGTNGNDVFLGDENYQNFRGDGGYDTFTGGVGRDHFRLESQTRYDPNSDADVLIDSYARITDFENADKISIENYGFTNIKSIVGNEFSVTQDQENNSTYISINTDQHAIENMFHIDGIFYLENYYTEIESENGDINLRITLSEENNNIDYNYIFGTDESETINGTDQADIISGGKGDDYIYAEEGNDIIVLSETGAQTFDGGEDNDTLEMHLQNWTIETGMPEGFIGEVDLEEGWAGWTEYPNHEGSDTIVDIENITLFGDVDYIIRGDEQDNILKSDSGDDYLYGGDGDDVLKSGAGDDFIYGGVGDDILILNGSGTQEFDGGDGIDTFKLDHTSFTGTLNPDYEQVIEIDLIRGISGQKDNVNLQDTIINIENIKYEGSTDVEMTGDDSNNLIKSDAGNDKLYGGDGNDVLVSGAGNDFIYGEAGDDVLVLTGSGTQLFDGGEGVDKFEISLPNWSTAPEGFVGGVNLELGIVGSEADLDNPLIDKLVSIENVTVIAQYGYVITGDNGNNVLIGGSGDDVLSTGDGNDSLSGGLGNDTLIISGVGDSTLDGGEGIDTFKIDLSNYIPPEGVTDFAYKADLSTGFVGSKNDPDHVNNDDIVNIENIDYSGSYNAELIGDDADNIIQSGDGDDYLYGGDGNDILKSGAGDDFIYGEAGNDIIIENGSGKQEYHGGAGNDTLKIELENFPNLPDDFVGEVDLVNGWAGPENDPDHELSDKLSGIENISVYGDKDYIIRGDAEDNILKSDSGDDYLYGGDGNDVLKSGAGDDFIYGGAGDDILILNGSGTQVFDGGDGIDTFKLDHSSFTGTLDPEYDQVIEIDLNREISGQKDNVNLQDKLFNIENIKYKGSTDVEMTGDSNDNIIISHHGNDIIYAGGGNDFINSGDGTDVITTGSGLDTIVIKPGHVNYTMGSADRITDFEDGSDQFQLDGMSFSDITIEQGSFGEYVNHTILTTSDGWLGVLENTTAININADDFYEIVSLDEGSSDDAKAEFTASIDKWSLGNDNLASETSWFEGPSMKLHRKDIEDDIGIDLTAKDGHPGHKHKPDMDKGEYELRVEHDQQTDGAIDINDVMGALSLAKGLAQPTSKEHQLAADWTGDGIIDINDVMGVLSRAKGLSKDDEWRFHDKTSDTSLWDNDSKMNKMDITLDENDDIDLTAILRGDVTGSYDASQHNRPDPSPAATPNYAPLPVNNDDELLTIPLDIV